MSCNYYQVERGALTRISYAFSTHRGTVKLKGRVGDFYGIWQGQQGNSLLEFNAKKEGDYLLITGKIYKCFGEGT